MNSQRLILLHFLQQNGSITEQQAINIGVKRLSSLINRLRNQGHDIELLNGWGERPSMYVYNK
jgi:hypothetical protein